MEGEITLKLSNFIKINPKRLHLSDPLEIPYPLYLTNNEQLKKSKHTMIFKTFTNGRYITSKPLKKRSNLVGTHIKS
jgi:hypothetical protein